MKPPISILVPALEAPRDGAPVITVTVAPVHPEWTGMLIVVCCYCKKVLGRKPCEPEKDGLLSHGLCPVCEARLNAEEDLAVLAHGHHLEHPQHKEAA